MILKRARTALHGPSPVGPARLGMVRQAWYKKRVVPCRATMPQWWPRHGPKESKPCLTCRAGPDTDFTKTLIQFRISHR